MNNQNQAIMTKLKYKFNEFLMNMQGILMRDHNTMEPMHSLHTYKLEELGNKLPGWQLEIQTLEDGKIVYLENRTTKLTVIYNSSNQFVRITDEYWKDLKMGFIRKSFNLKKYCLN